MRQPTDITFNRGAFLKHLADVNRLGDFDESAKGDWSVGRAFTQMLMREQEIYPDEDERWIGNPDGALYLTVEPGVDIPGKVYSGADMLLVCITDQLEGISLDSNMEQLAGFMDTHYARAVSKGFQQLLDMEPDDFFTWRAYNWI